MAVQFILPARGITHMPARQFGLWRGNIGQVVAATDFADPRQGTILYLDTDPLGVDPRQGTILYPDTDPGEVDPRQGSVIN